MSQNNKILIQHWHNPEPDRFKSKWSKIQNLSDVIDKFYTRQPNSRQSITKTNDINSDRLQFDTTQLETTQDQNIVQNKMIRNLTRPIKI